MKKKEYIYSLVFSIVFLVGLVSIVSYGFIGGKPENSGVSNVEGEIINPSDILNITGDTNFSLNITLDDLNIENADNDGENFIEDSKMFFVSLDVDSALTSDIQCDYSIYYEPTVVYHASQASIDAELVELGFSGTDGVRSFGPISIDDISTKTLLYTGTIVTNKQNGGEPDNNGIVDSWKVSYRFYNLNVDQSDALGQSPSGKIVVEADQCKSVN